MKKYDKFSQIEKFDGLTNIKQLKEIYSFIKNNFKSKGDIVELGTFLGKTTKTLLEALPYNSKRKIYTYDNFIWNWNHKRKFPRVRLNINQNFLEYVKKKINSKKVIFRKSLIEDLKWNGGCIELLVLDAPKNFDELNNIFFKLSPFFKTNITKIIFLDYSISIKYDTQLFLNHISKNFLVEVSSKGIAFCRYKQRLNIIKSNNFKLIRKMEADKIFKFWDRVFKSIDNNMRIRLSLLPALHLYDNNYFLKSIQFVLFKNVYVQKKYVFIKYMIKRYPILYPFIVINLLRGKYFI